MYAEAAAIAYLLGDFAYHRWINPPEKPKPPPGQEIQVPRVDEGAVYPLIYGRCRVNSPVLAWVGTPHAAFNTPSGGFIYAVNMFFQVGVPFENGVSKIHGWYFGDALMVPNTDASTDYYFPGQAVTDLTLLTGDGNYERDTRLPFMFYPYNGQDGFYSGTRAAELEFLNGNPNQTLVHPVTFVPNTLSGELMIADGVDATLIPGYRGFLSVLLARIPDPIMVLDLDGCIVMQPTVPSVGFDVSSYSAPVGTMYCDSGEGLSEANPAAVIYDLLTGKFGKLGLPPSRIDRLGTFESVGNALAAEGHGYSRAIEQLEDASEIIQDILRQIDGVLYEDPTNGLIKLKLIRADYNLADVPTIEPGICDRLENFSLGSWANIPNKVRVVYTARGNQYRDDSAIAHNLAHASGQDGQVHEVVLHMPGICARRLAEDVAARELSALSRPMAKCRAIVDRQFRLKVPGDVVAVRWPDYHLDGMLFRIAAVDRGSLKDGKIALDLIQDFFYEYRGIHVNHGGTVGSFPTGGGVVLGG